MANEVRKINRRNIGISQSGCAKRKEIESDTFRRYVRYTRINCLFFVLLSPRHDPKRPKVQNKLSQKNVFLMKFANVT